MYPRYASGWAICPKLSGLKLYHQAPINANDLRECNQRFEFASHHKSMCKGVHVFLSSYSRETKEVEIEGAFIIFYWNTSFFCWKTWKCENSFEMHAWGSRSNRQAYRCEWAQITKVLDWTIFQKNSILFMWYVKFYIITLLKQFFVPYDFHNGNLNNSGDWYSGKTVISRALVFLEVSISKYVIHEEARNEKGKFFLFLFLWKWIR